MHKLEQTSQKSTFPIALGVRVTGVDDATFSQTGESFSTIALPKADSHITRTLQEDDTALGMLEEFEPLDRWGSTPPTLAETRCAPCAQPTNLLVNSRA